MSEGGEDAERREGVFDDFQLKVGVYGELYPTFRWFLYDGLLRYAAPMTIFGPKRAALYIGNMYLVLNGTEHVRALAGHFDDLIRSAVVQPSDVVIWLKRLSTELAPRRSRATKAVELRHGR